MPEKNTTQENFQALVRLLDTKNVADNLFEAFKAMVSALSQLKSDTEEERAVLKQQVSDALSTFEAAIASIRQPEDGKDYVLTESDKKEIAATIKVPIVEKIVETVIKEQPILNEITNNIENKETADDVRNKLEAGFIDAPEEEKIDPRVIKGFQELENKLKQVAARPSGSVAGGRQQLLVGSVEKGVANYLNLVAGSNVTLTHTLVNGVQTVTFDSTGGSGFSTLAATETPNGVRTVFTFSTASAQPSFIMVDNVWQKPISKAGTVNWTWASGPKQATLSVPPNDDILGIV